MYTHKPNTIKEAMKIPESSAAIEKYWDAQKNLLALGFKKVKPKTEVVRHAKMTEYLFMLHPSWIFLCYLKYAELANQYGRCRR